MQGNLRGPFFQVFEAFQDTLQEWLTELDERLLLNLTGVIKLPILVGSSKKQMLLVFLRDFLYNSALFGLVIWVFPKIGVPQNGWFIMENPIKFHDLGVHLFLETPI